MILLTDASSILFFSHFFDSTGIYYLPTPLIFGPATKKPVNGLSVIPVDLDGNGRINDDARFYDDRATVIQKLEQADQKDIQIFQ